MHAGISELQPVSGPYALYSAERLSHVLFVNVFRSFLCWHVDCGEEQEEEEAQDKAKTA